MSQPGSLLTICPNNDETPFFLFVFATYLTVPLHWYTATFSRWSQTSYARHLGTTSHGLHTLKFSRQATVPTHPSQTMIKNLLYETSVGDAATRALWSECCFSANVPPRTPTDLKGCISVIFITARLNQYQNLLSRKLFTNLLFLTSYTGYLKNNRPHTEQKN